MNHSVINYSVEFNLMLTFILCKNYEYFTLIS